MDAPPPFPAQDILANSMEEIITNTAIKVTKACSTSLERKHIRPHQKERALNCPRCNSTNTKFCYYNNYSLTQPRYFCKTCRRYWTQGGSLRNIPVGGKIRKNKRLSSSSSSKIQLHDIIDQPSSVINISTNPNPKLIHYHAQDLNLGDFTSTHMHLPNNIMEAANSSINTHFNQTINASNNASYLSAMERLTGINPFIPMQRSDPTPVYEVGFPFQGDFRPSFQGVHESVAGRILFPFDNVKNTTTIDSKEADDQHGGSSSYWTGDILGGAGSW